MPLGLLTGARCSFFDHGCNLLRAGDVDRVAGAGDFNLVWLLARVTCTHIASQSRAPGQESAIFLCLRCRPVIHFRSKTKIA
jgi:hypothetical protein